MEHEPKIYNTFNFFICPTKYTLLVVTFRLRGCQKYRAMIVFGMTCQWYSRANNIIIKKKHNKH